MKNIKIFVKKAFKIMGDNSLLVDVEYNKVLTQNYDASTDRYKESKKQYLLKGVLSSYSKFEANNDSILLTDVKFTCLTKLLKTEPDLKDKIILKNQEYKIVSYTIDELQGTITFQMRK